MEQKKVFDQNYSKYYNLFYSDKNYSSEVEYIQRKIEKHRPGSKSILEYGSGTGGHGLLFKSKGYDIIGIERSEEMAQIAMSKGLDCRIGDITSFELNRKFDCCIAMFHVVSYINPNELLIKLFQNTLRHLNKRGIFIFDVWFTPAVLHQQPELRVKRIEDQQMEVIRIATPVNHHIENVVDVNYEILVRDKATGLSEEFKESHKMRHFGVPEIDLCARQTGFSLVSVEEFMTERQPSAETWGVNFILQSNA